MACLYSPYNLSRVTDGGFCDPVRILLTVLSAWLNTRSDNILSALLILDPIRLPRHRRRTHRI